jgi:hypothetical protein
MIRVEYFSKPTGSPTMPFLYLRMWECYLQMADMKREICGWATLAPTVTPVGLSKQLPGEKDEGV